MQKMKWFFDILKEWVEAQGFLTQSFFDRGDPRTGDWSEGAFTIDGAWHELDCSAIVPEGAKGILFSLEIASFHLGSWFRMRKNGNSFEGVATYTNIQVSDIWNGYDLVVACDENRIVEYKGVSVHFSVLELTVKGWWF